MMVETSFEASFLTFRARLMFANLRQALLKVLIFYYFHLKFYIWIETRVSSQTIGKVLN